MLQVWKRVKRLVSKMFKTDDGSLGVLCVCMRNFDTYTYTYTNTYTHHESKLSFLLLSVTEKVWESDSTDASEDGTEAPPPLSTPPTSSNKPSPHSRQPSLMSFFKK